MELVSSTLGHQANRLLAALEPDDLAWLEPHLEVVELPKGLTIYEVGETIQYAYFPHDAIVSLFTVLKEGGSVEVAVFGREAVIDLVSALVSDQAFGRYLVQRSGTASRIASQLVHRAAAARPNIRLVFRRYAEALLTQTFQTMACNTAHVIECRCCRYILSMHDRVDQDTLPITHELLAKILGVQRSSVSAVTRTLQEAGLICQARGSITVIDRVGLEEAACECYGIIRSKFEALLPRTYQRS
jgi:CRP-like cAMP-binding protein